MAHVLVAEDNPDLREALALTLASVGHRVETTGSGREAAVLAGRERYDLVLLDLDVEELAGDAVARVVADVGDTPIVAMSGRSDSWQRRLLDAGVTACLGKPYSSERLLSLVRAVVRGTSGSRENGWFADVRQLSGDDLRRLASLSRAELDALPFGVIALGRDGRIVEYNAYEQDASTYWRPTVVGMRFFDLAPCTMVKELSRQLERGLRGEPLDDVLRFVFPHHGGTCVVSVRLYGDTDTGRVWVFVSKRRGSDR